MSSSHQHFLKNQQSLARRALARGSRTAISAKLAHASRMTEAVLREFGLQKLKRGIGVEHYLWFLEVYCQNYKPSYRYRYYRIVYYILRHRGLWWTYAHSFENKKWSRP